MYKQVGLHPMSIITKSVIGNINVTLDNIFNTLHRLEYSNAAPSFEPPVVSSSILTCIDKTKAIYTWSQENGSFMSTNHVTNYADVMARWSALIEDLHWSIFGTGNVFDCVENNRMKILHLKLNHIQIKLDELVTTGC